VDERLVLPLRQQLTAWRGLLAAGAERVGWKLGRGTEAERFGPVIGHLTSATRLEPGAVYRAGAPSDLRVDAEFAVAVGAHGRAAGFATALELVDLDRPTDDVEAVVVSNVFHRAFVLGATAEDLPGDVHARATVNGELRASAPAAYEPGLIERAAELLAAVGERLEPGDRVITGSIVQVPVAAGDEVEVELDGLGRLRVQIV